MEIDQILRAQALYQMATGGFPRLDKRAVVSAMLTVFGLPQECLKNEEEVALFERRSAAAQKGWVTRRLRRIS